MASVSCADLTKSALLVSESIFINGCPMKKREKLLRACSVGVILFLFCSCATAPNNLPSTYVSPLKYRDYDCDQIAAEMDHISARTAQLYGSLNQKAVGDAIQMGIALGLFWPAIFLLEGGDGVEAQEYSRLKGEFEALRETAVQKKCACAQYAKSPDEVVQERVKAQKAAKGKKKDKKGDTREEGRNTQAETEKTENNQEPIPALLIP